MNNYTYHVWAVEHTSITFTILSDDCIVPKWCKFKICNEYLSQNSPTFFVAQGKNTEYKNNPQIGPPNADRILAETCVKIIVWCVLYYMFFFETKNLDCIIHLKILEENGWYMIWNKCSVKNSKLWKEN